MEGTGKEWEREGREGGKEGKREGEGMGWKGDGKESPPLLADHFNHCSSVPLLTGEEVASEAQEVLAGIFSQRKCIITF